MMKIWKREITRYKRLLVFNILIGARYIVSNSMVSSETYELRKNKIDKFRHSNTVDIFMYPYTKIGW